jgi:hypothetical protein
MHSRRFATSPLAETQRLRHGASLNLKALHTPITARTQTWADGTGARDSWVRFVSAYCCMFISLCDSGLMIVPRQVEPSVQNDASGFSFEQIPIGGTIAKPFGIRQCSENVLPSS